MKAALIGYGKMGREIEKQLVQRGHQVVLVVDEHGASEFSAKLLRESGAEVAIEFSTPNTAFDNVMVCLEAGVAVVCGTTGWLKRKQEVEERCRVLRGAFFYASNYSIGMNVFFKVNQLLARLMDGFGEYDVTVEETHHVQKKDAPSGTAITIAEDIVDRVERKDSWVAEPTTEHGRLGVTSVRRSVVAGTHKVVWESEVDVLEICHTAKNRGGLAVGAVMAAEFVVGREGVFSMDDLLQM